MSGNGSAQWRSFIQIREFLLILDEVTRVCVCVLVCVLVCHDPHLREEIEPLESRGRCPAGHNILNELRKRSNI